MSAATGFSLSLPVSGVWTKFKSSPQIEHDGFNWTICGEYMYRDTSSLLIRDIAVQCCPTVKNPKRIWQCCVSIEIATSVVNERAYSFRNIDGEFVRFDSENISNEFSYRHQVEFNKRTMLFCCQNTNSSVFHLAFHLEVWRNVSIDLSDHRNSMITSYEDARRIDIGQEYVWVSQSVLSTASPYFSVLLHDCNDNPLPSVNFLENVSREYNIPFNDQNGKGFNAFIDLLALLYDIYVPIDEDTVGQLFFVADYFQCEKIRKDCETVLCHTTHRNDAQMVQRLLLSDRCKLDKLKHQMITDLDEDELCSIVHRFELLNLDEEFMNQIEEKLWHGLYIRFFHYFDDASSPKRYFMSDMDEE